MSLHSINECSASQEIESSVSDSRLQSHRDLTKSVTESHSEVLHGRQQSSGQQSQQRSPQRSPTMSHSLDGGGHGDRSHGQSEATRQSPSDAAAESNNQNGKSQEVEGGERTADKVDASGETPDGTAIEKAESMIVNQAESKGGGDKANDNVVNESTPVPETVPDKIVPRRKVRERAEAAQKSQMRESDANGNADSAPSHITDSPSHGKMMPTADSHDQYLSADGNAETSYGEDTSRDKNLGDSSYGPGRDSNTENSREYGSNDHGNSYSNENTMNSYSNETYNENSNDTFNEKDQDEHESQKDGPQGIQTSDTDALEVFRQLTQLARILHGHTNFPMRNVLFAQTGADEDKNRLPVHSSTTGEGTTSTGEGTQTMAGQKNAKQPQSGRRSSWSANEHRALSTPHYSRGVRSGYDHYDGEERKRSKSADDSDKHSKERRNYNTDSSPTWPWGSSSDANQDLSPEDNFDWRKTKSGDTAYYAHGRSPNNIKRKRKKSNANSTGAKKSASSPHGSDSETLFPQSSEYSWGVSLDQSSVSRPQSANRSLGASRASFSRIGSRRVSKDEIGRCFESKEDGSKEGNSARINSGIRMGSGSEAGNPRQRLSVATMASTQNSGRNESHRDWSGRGIGPRSVGSGRLSVVSIGTQPTMSGRGGPRHSQHSQMSNLELREALIENARAALFEARLDMQNANGDANAEINGSQADPKADNAAAPQDSHSPGKNIDETGSKSLDLFGGIGGKPKNQTGDGKHRLGLSFGARQALLALADQHDLLALVGKGGGLQSDKSNKGSGKTGTGIEGKGTGKALEGTDEGGNRKGSKPADGDQTTKGGAQVTDNVIMNSRNLNSTFPVGILRVPSAPGSRFASRPASSGRQPHTGRGSIPGILASILDVDNEGKSTSLSPDPSPRAGTAALHGATGTSHTVGPNAEENGAKDIDNAANDNATQSQTVQKTQSQLNAGAERITRSDPLRRPRAVSQISYVDPIKQLIKMTSGNYNQFYQRGNYNPLYSDRDRVGSPMAQSPQNSQRLLQFDSTAAESDKKELQEGFDKNFKDFSSYSNLK